MISWMCTWSLYFSMVVDSWMVVDGCAVSQNVALNYAIPEFRHKMELTVSGHEKYNLI